MEHHEGALPRDRVEVERLAAAFPPGRWRARWIWARDDALLRRAATSAWLGARTAGLEKQLPEALSASPNSWALFRRRVDLAEVPASVPTRVTVDGRYVLWANGVEVCRGPVRGDPSLLRYDVVDLAPFLRPGENVLAIQARHYGEAVPWWRPAPGVFSLGFGALVFEARLGEEWLLSDGEWQVLVPDAWKYHPPGLVAARPVEDVDARSIPADWREVRESADGWSAATELSGRVLGWNGRDEPPSYPYGPMLARPIGVLTGEVREAALWARRRGPSTDRPGTPGARAVADAQSPDLVTIPTGDGADVVLDPDAVDLLVFDFGEVVAGTLVLDIDAPAGTRIDLATGELEDAGGGPVMDGFYQSSGIGYTARGGRDRFETFDPIGLRFAIVSVRGEGEVHLRVSLRERLHPRTDEGAFSCSDPDLDDVWRIGVRSVHLNSQDAYLDCPTREQTAWVGDSVVHQMVDLTTNGNWDLARWNVQLAASPRSDGMLPMAVAGHFQHDDPTYIPDWSLHWIRSLHNLFRYTGDRRLVAELLPVAEGVLRWFDRFSQPTGLVAELPGWCIIDWSAVSADGASAAMNGLYGRALLDVADMATWLGDPGRAERALDRHEALVVGFEAFWDPARALYVDTVLDGVRQPVVSQHGLASAIVGGCAPAHRHDDLVGALLDEDRLVHAAFSVADGPTVDAPDADIGGVYLFTGPPPPWWDVERQIVRAQPFFRYVVHDALARAGRADLVAGQCRDWLALRDRCATSWSESWYAGTVSHGWSATPTRDLVQHVLGVQPGVPGFLRARVAPALGGLEWARGRVPTPFGPIEVDVSPGRLDVRSPVPVDAVFDGEVALVL